MKKRCFLSAAVCLMLTACSIGNSADTVRFFAFDTFISAEITSSSHNVSSECAEEIRSAFENLDNVFSPYNENSEIYSFNSGKADIADSNIIAMTDGYKRVRDILGDGLTPACGSITMLWNVTSDSPKVPDEKEISEALRHVYPIDDIEKNGVNSLPGDAVLDFGAGAKGFACDAAYDIVSRSEKVTKAVVSSGSSSLLYGQDTFTAAIVDPFEGGELCTFAADGGFISTAGGYERYFIENGVKYSHIFDMKTGYPADTDLVSVTVYLPFGDGNGAFSDLASTLIYMGGTEKLVGYSEKLAENFSGYSLAAVTEDREIYVFGDVDIALKKDGFTLHGGDGNAAFE